MVRRARQVHLTMSRAVCERTAAWVNQRCRDNMDSRTEPGGPGGVTLMWTLAPWVAVHFEECAAINTPPSTQDATGGRCRCYDITKPQAPPATRPRTGGRRRSR
jgi:hypothetical protein